MKGRIVLLKRINVDKNTNSFHVQVYGLNKTKLHVRSLDLPYKYWLVSKSSDKKRICLKLILS